MSVVDVIGHLSFVIVAISFLMKDIIWLRAFSIFSGIVGITYNFTIPVGPLWIPIIWLTIFIAINIYMIIIFYVANRKSGFSEEDIKIWKKNFWGLSAEEFRNIRKIIIEKNFHPNSKVLEKNKETNYVYFINSGLLKVNIDGDIPKKLSSGDVAGEMSFISNSNANADVISETTTRCLAVEKTKLRKAMLRSPSFHISMTNLFNQNLMKKISL